MRRLVAATKVTMLTCAIGQTFQFASRAVVYISAYLSRICAALRNSITPIEPTNNMSCKVVHQKSKIDQEVDLTPRGALCGSSIQ